MVPTPTKAPFWRAFGAGLVLYAASLSIWAAVVTDGYDLINRLILLVVVFGVLALIFPRSAAILLVVMSTWGIAQDVFYGFDHAWHFLLLPFDIGAIVYAIVAFKLASAYLGGKKEVAQRREEAAQRREEMARNYERDQPW